MVDLIVGRNTGGIIGYQPDIDVDEVYGYWTTPGLNYNFGLSSTMTGLETKKVVDEKKEMLADLMTESLGESSSQRTLEDVERQTAGVEQKSTNLDKPTNQLGTGRRIVKRRTGTSMRF